MAEELIESGCSNAEVLEAPEELLGDVAHSFVE